MYSKVISCNGCLSFFIVFFVFIICFKYLFFALLFLIPMLILLIAIKNFATLKRIVTQYFVQNTEYKSRQGKVYKQCVFCGTKTSRSDKICPKCKRSFE